MEIVEIKIADQNGLLIRVGLGGDAVPGEGEVGGCQHRRLPVLHVHVVHVREVADVAGHGQVDLVLDRSGLGAVADAEITLTVVRAEGNEDDLRSLVGEEAGGLGKLDIVADEHADPGLRGVDDAQAVAALDAPPPLLIRGDVNLWLLDHLAVRHADKADVLKGVTDMSRMAPADDRQIEPPRQLGEELHIPGRVFGKASHALLGGLGLGCREQLHGDQLGQQDVIRPVITGDVDKVGDLPGKLSKRLHLAHLVLDAGDPALPRTILDRLVVRVQPLQQAGVVVALGIAQVVGHDAPQEKTLA